MSPKAKIILGIVAVGFLWFAGQEAYVFLTNLHPTQISCQDFLQGKSDAKWVELTDCDVDYLNTIQLKSAILKVDKGCYVPVRPHNAVGPSRIALMIDSSKADQKIRE